MIHTWNIDDLKRNVANGLITTASYHCKSKEGDMFAQITSGEINLDSKNTEDSDFVQYTDLTQNIVLSWVTGSLDVNAIETANSASIATKITNYNSRTQETGLPW
jgi:hypothetical protein